MEKPQNQSNAKPFECPPFLRIKKPKKKKVKMFLAKLVLDPKTGIPIAPPLPYKLPPLPKKSNQFSLMKMNTVVPASKTKLVEPKQIVKRQQT